MTVKCRKIRIGLRLSLPDWGHNSNSNLIYLIEEIIPTQIDQFKSNRHTPYNLPNQSHIPLVLRFSTSFLVYHLHYYYFGTFCKKACKTITTLLKKIDALQQNTRMEQPSLASLPSEILINIMSRLPVRTAARCRCVCRPWLDLLTTPNFAASHLARSAPGLVIYQSEINRKLFTLFEFQDSVTTPLSPNLI